MLAGNNVIAEDDRNEDEGLQLVMAANVVLNKRIERVVVVMRLA